MLLLLLLYCCPHLQYLQDDPFCHHPTMSLPVLLLQASSSPPAC